MLLFNLPDAKNPRFCRISGRTFPRKEPLCRLPSAPPSPPTHAGASPAAAAGYLGMEFVLDEGSITNVAVFPGCRRQGVADALVTGLLHRAAAIGLATVTLEVRQSNAPAIALYHKHGFVPVGRRNNYNTSPTADAILMTAPVK